MAPMIKADEVSQMLGVSKSHVYDLAQDGEIPAHHIGRSVRFNRADIVAWLAARKAQGTKPKAKREYIAVPVDQSASEHLF